MPTKMAWDVHLNYTQQVSNCPKKDGAMRKPRGFSLIELLIVVAIILIIAAIAIPNLIKSRIQANEASAIASLRDINISEATYNATYPSTGYTCSLTYLGGTSATNDPTAAGILDPGLSTGIKSGYSFNLSNCTSAGGITVTYSTDGAPLVQGQTGIRFFCSDNSGRILFGSSYPCTMPAFN